MLFLPFTATTPPHKDDVTNPLQLKGSPSSKTLKALASFKSFTERAAGRDSPSKSPPLSKSSCGSSIPVTVYSVADLQTATNSFGQENLVGENSLGCVYRGIFQDDQVMNIMMSLQNCKFCKLMNPCSSWQCLCLTLWFLHFWWNSLILVIAILVCVALCNILLLGFQMKF